MRDRPDLRCGTRDKKAARIGRSPPWNSSSASSAVFDDREDCRLTELEHFLLTITVFNDASNVRSRPRWIECRDRLTMRGAPDVAVSLRHPKFPAAITAPLDVSASKNVAALASPHCANSAAA